MGLDLTECKERIKWASNLFGKLREAVKDYEESEPYELRQEFVASRYESRLYITPKPVPMDISFLAGDVVHNLRSTLDHLAWQLALTTGAPEPTFPLGNDPESRRWRDLIFPLRLEEKDPAKWLPDRLRNVSPDMAELLRDIQPFAVGDNPRLATLWMLHELSNVDKHRVPLMAVPSLHETGTLTVKTPLSRANRRILEHAVVPKMLEGETLLMRVGFDTVPLSMPHLEWEHGIWVAFHDSLGIGPGMPVADMLDMMLAMVKYVITKAEQIGAKTNSGEDSEGTTEAAPS